MAFGGPKVHHVKGTSKTQNNRSTQLPSQNALQQGQEMLKDFYSWWLGAYVAPHPFTCGPLCKMNVEN